MVSSIGDLAGGNFANLLCPTAVLGSCIWAAGVLFLVRKKIFIKI